MRETFALYAVEKNVAYYFDAFWFIIKGLSFFKGCPKYLICISTTEQQGTPTCVASNTLLSPFWSHSWNVNQQELAKSHI